MSEQPAKNEPPWKRLWKEETSWTAKELAKLCCGWAPDTGWDPDCGWDPHNSGQGLFDETDVVSWAYDFALQKIRRAEQMGDLKAIALPRSATPDELSRGDAPVFRSREAAAWAAKRFPDFPYKEDDWLEASTPAPTIAELTTSAPAMPAVPVESLVNTNEAVDGAESHDSRPAESMPNEIARRGKLLQDYIAATGVRTHAKIYRDGANVHKPQFYGWRKGTLSAHSVTAKRLEQFLTKKEAPPPRKPT